MDYLPFLEILNDLNLTYTISRMKKKNHQGYVSYSDDVLITIILSDDKLVEVVVTKEYWKYPTLTSYFLNFFYKTNFQRYHEGTPFLKDVVKQLEASMAYETDN